jgi:hypothetical protein
MPRAPIVRRCFKKASCPMQLAVHTLKAAIANSGLGTFFQRLFKRLAAKTSPVVNSNRASAHCPCGFNLLCWWMVQSAFPAAGGYAETHVRACPAHGRKGLPSAAGENGTQLYLVGDGGGQEAAAPDPVRSGSIFFPGPAPWYSRSSSRTARAMNRSFLAMMHAIRWEGSRRFCNFP